MKLNKSNLNWIAIIKIFYKKSKNVRIVSLFLHFYRIRSIVNLIIKFIFLLILLFTNYAELTSVWDFSDLFLKIVEKASSTNVKVENNINTDDAALQIVEDKETKEDVEDIDFDAMEFGEWLDYLREHEPKAYWGLVLAFCATTLFCIWLMHKIIGPAFPPRDL